MTQVYAKHPLHGLQRGASTLRVRDVSSCPRPFGAVRCAVLLCFFLLKKKGGGKKTRHDYHVKATSVVLKCGEIMYVGGSIPAVLKQLMRPPAVTLELIFIFFFFKLIHHKSEHKLDIY